MPVHAVPQLVQHADLLMLLAAAAQAELCLLKQSLLVLAVVSRPQTEAVPTSMTQVLFLLGLAGFQQVEFPTFEQPPGSFQDSRY